MVLGSSFTFGPLSTATRGVVMIYLLLFLIPMTALLGWAARLGWTRRRREITGHHISAARLAVRREAQRTATEWGAGR